MKIRNFRDFNDFRDFDDFEDFKDFPGFQGFPGFSGFQNPSNRMVSGGFKNRDVTPQCNTPILNPAPAAGPLAAGRLRHPIYQR